MPLAAGASAADANTSQLTREQRTRAARRSLRRRRTVSTISHAGVLNPMQNLLGSIDRFQDIQILNRDHFLAQQGVTDPVEQAFPVVPSDEDDGERLDLARLDQSDCLEQFIKRPESAGQNYKGDRVLHEHDFPNEEISKVQKLVRENVRPLFERQFDIQADRSGASFGSAFV